MNQLDKFSVNFEIWLNCNVLGKKPEKALQSLLKTFASENQDQINYILSRFHKKKCPSCDGRGFQPL